MDASRFIALALVSLSFVLLSNQLTSNEVGNLCPFVDNAKTVNGVYVHNITRTAKCFNGWKMAGCCVERVHCDFNTSHIDLTLYGPPGFRTPCEVCCPMKYILPMPSPNTTDDDSSMDDSNSNSVDSVSDENV